MCILHCKTVSRHVKSESVNGPKHRRTFFTELSEDTDLWDTVSFSMYILPNRQKNSSRFSVAFVCSSYRTTVDLVSWLHMH